VEDADAIRAALVQQVKGTVRWRESVLWLRDNGVGRLVEAGTGKVLSGLARRIDRDLETVSLSEPEDIEAFL
jgi:[acyl-carrier-protein] S-malonyltransferase